MEGVALEKGIELFQLNTVFLELFVLCAEIAGWGFTLRPGFGALENDLFAHGVRLPKVGV